MLLILRLPSSFRGLKWNWMLSVRVWNWMSSIRVAPSGLHFQTKSNKILPKQAGNQATASWRNLKESLAEATATMFEVEETVSYSPVLWRGAPQNARSGRSAAHYRLRFQREQCFRICTARFLVWFLEQREVIHLNHSCRELTLHTHTYIGQFSRYFWSLTGTIMWIDRTEIASYSLKMF